MLFRIFIALALVAFISACSTTEPLIVMDAQGRLIKKTDKETGKVTELTYDESGNIITKKVTAAEGITLITFNKNGSLARLDQIDGSLWEFEYTSDNKLKTIKDPAGNVTLYLYDQDGKPLKKILPDGTIEIEPEAPVDPVTMFSDKPAELDKPSKPTFIDDNINRAAFSYDLPGKPTRANAKANANPE